jgi:hypothetical protein
LPCSASPHSALDLPLSQVHSELERALQQMTNQIPLAMSAAVTTADRHEDEGGGMSGYRAAVTVERRCGLKYRRRPARASQRRDGATGLCAKRPPPSAIAAAGTRDSPASGRRPPGGSVAPRQVWGCKGAAQPTEQTAEWQMYSWPSPPLSPLSAYQARSARYPPTKM